ncbi:MAG: M20 family metallopeptidase [Acidimicrobiales bacterium]
MMNPEQDPYKQDLYQRVQADIDQRAESLIATSHAIFDTPELRFEEHHAAKRLSDELEAGGVSVTRKAFGIDTAFMAEAGTEGPLVVVCCEYDALPTVGHACGHNIIGAAGLGAGLAAAALAGELGGRVRVLGTPGEEGGGGKVILGDAGAFDGVEAAIMIHPADADLLSMTTLAVAITQASWHGKSSHAAAFPHLGKNALDAAVLSYQNVAALRQHLRPTDRVHGVFVKGGEVPNIVPEHTVMEWMVRTQKLGDLDALHERVVACFEAGALATGCTFEHTSAGPTYADMVDNPVLAGRFATHAAAMGRQMRDPRSGGHQVVGSTDMGNVSHLVPAIHPMLKVAPAGVSIHSHEFASHARSTTGDQAVLDGATLMARLIVDLWTEPEMVTAIKDAFSHQATDG